MMTLQTLAPLTGALLAADAKTSPAEAARRAAAVLAQMFAYYDPTEAPRVRAGK